MHEIQEFQAGFQVEQSYKIYNKIMLVMQTLISIAFI